jgi:5-methyltetrahydrofolate--homocysteine methyltransferase
MTALSALGPATLLDGAMGTALLDRGLPGGLVPEAWLLERPWEIAGVHAGHVAAGAEAVLTCTFNLARLDLAAPGLGPEDVARRAFALARASGAPTVAACVGATGLTLGGAGPADGELRERYEGAFRALVRAGATLAWTESHLSLREARAAVAAGRRTGMDVVATVHAAPSGDGPALLDGTPCLEALVALARDGAVAVGVNCVDPDRALVAMVARAAVAVSLPLVVKANAGLPGSRIGPEPFAAWTTAAVRAGARLAGGCCGSGPAHLRALAAALGRGPAQARG